MLVIVLVFSPELAAQTPGLSGVNVVFRRLSTEQGLSDNSVWAITQDRQGFVWIGTANGLNRFDGKQCVVYHARPDSTGLSNDGVWALYADWDGSLWIGTQHGLNRFYPSTRTFKKYFHDPQNPTSLSSNKVRSICRDQTGVLWVGTAWGLNRFESSTSTWVRFLPNAADSTKPGENFIDAIFEDRQGALWIGTGHYFTRGGGLFQFERSRGRFSRYIMDSSDLDSPSQRWITSLSEDASHNFWICSDIQGVARLDQMSGVLTQFSLPDNYRWFGPTDMIGGKRSTPHAVKGVCEDRSGAFWIAAWGSGLFRFDRGTRKFTEFLGNPSDPRSLSSPFINTIFLDRAGLLWVGTDGGGVNMVSTKPFVMRQMFGDSLLLQNRVEALICDREGALWIGILGNGAWRYDPTTQRASPVLPRFVVSDFCLDREGGIWILGPTILARYDLKKNQSSSHWRVPHSYLEERGTRLVLDSEDCIWIGTNRGVYRVEKDRQQFTHFVYSQQNAGSISEDQVESIFEDKRGSIWVGTWSGLYRFNKKTQMFTRFFHDEQDSSSLSDDWCTGILEDEFGSLWISTHLGLNRFNETDSSFTRFLDQPVERIVRDHMGRFWFATTGGITMFDPSDGRTRSFDASDGIPDVKVWGYSRTLLKGGELVFGTGTGVLVFHPDRAEPLAYVPPVVITAVKKFRKAMPHQTSPELLREIAFEHDENVFSVEYAALSYDMPEYNQYAYMLEGFDEDWVYCGNRQEATYTNLDPGTYTFRVKGSNHDGVWNEAGTSLMVVIRPAYWQTWWFRGLLILAAIGLVGSGVGYAERMRANRRIEQLERERAVERERTRISQDMHDEVGSSLSEISILSELVKRDLRKPDQAAVQVQQISERAAELIDNVSEIVWAMTPKNDTLDNLVAHLRRHSVKYVSLAEMHCSFSAPDVIPACYVTAEVRRNAFLVVKEALHNIVKHSGASEVTIGVALTEQKMETSICDNGRGFVSGEERGSGNGLLNMRKRMADIGGEFRIESTPGAGTRITIVAPLTDARRSP